MALLSLVSRKQLSVTFLLRTLRTKHLSKELYSAVNTRRDRLSLDFSQLLRQNAIEIHYAYGDFCSYFRFFLLQNSNLTTDHLENLEDMWYGVWGKLLMINNKKEVKQTVKAGIAVKCQKFVEYFCFSDFDTQTLLPVL